MLYILIGVFGFVFLLVFDFMSLKNRVVGKYFFAISGLAIIVYSTYQLVDLGSDLLLGTGLQVFGLLNAMVFLALLIYSVFIEVGGNTYQKIPEPQLVTNGTYSLVRHPGVIWLFLAYLSMAFYTENSIIFLTAIIWTIVNTLYVVLQEKFILNRIFPNYSEYVKTTPMVIPTYMSFKRFFTTRNWRRE